VGNEALPLANDNPFDDPPDLLEPVALFHDINQMSMEKAAEGRRGKRGREEAPGGDTTLRPRATSRHSSAKVRHARKGDVTDQQLANQREMEEWASPHITAKQIASAPGSTPGRQ